MLLTLRRTQLNSPALRRSCAPVCSRDGVAWRARSVHAADRQRDHAHHHRARPGPALQGPARPPPTPDMRPLWPCPMQLTQLQQQPSLLAHAPALHSPASCRSACCSEHRPAGADVLLAVPAPPHARAAAPGPGPARSDGACARLRRAWTPARARRSTRSSCTGPRLTPSTRATSRRSWATSSPAWAASSPM